MIMKLLEIRTILLKIYQKARFIINPIIKFFIAIMVFKWINGEIGYDARFTSTTIVMLLSVICAVTPGGVLVFFAMMLTLLHVYSVSMFLAVLLLLMFIVLYGMLMRFSPKQALAAVAVPLLAKYNLHYCVPMVLGCIANPLAILPTACGVIIYNMMGVIKAASTRQVSIKDMDAILLLYTDVIDAFIANKQMIITIAVFAIVIIAIFVIRKCSFDFAFLLSIGAGVVVNILGFLVADLHYDVTVNVGSLILMSLVAGVIAVILEFFKRVLDYSAIERVCFEDDDYLYYVKAVPKVNVSIPRHNVKRMSDYEDDDESNNSASVFEYGDGDYEEEAPGTYHEYDSKYSSDFSDEEDVRYEDYDITDFDDHDDRFDSSIYSMKMADDDDDEGYEVEMTLDDDDK